MAQSDLQQAYSFESRATDASLDRLNPEHTS